MSVKTYLEVLKVRKNVFILLGMTKTKRRKKTGLATCEHEDWDRADIKAALEKAGWSLRQLSIHHGLTPKTFQHALQRPYPKAEAAIAEVIGVHPSVIWPSRYGADGRPNRKRGRRAKNPELQHEQDYSTTTECHKPTNQGDNDD